MLRNRARQLSKIMLSFKILHYQKVSIFVVITDENESRNVLAVSRGDLTSGSIRQEV